MEHRMRFFLAVFALTGFLAHGCMNTDDSQGKSTPSNNGVFELSDDDSQLNEALGNSNWKLVKVQEDGREAPLPTEKFFVIHFQVLPPVADRACIGGSCAWKYDITGQGFCGPLTGKFSRGFSESLARIVNQFESLSEDIPRDCTRGSDSRRILNWMDDPGMVLNYEPGEQLLYMQWGSRILIFEAGT